MKKNNYDPKFNAFHRHAVQYIIGIHKDKESQGSPRFDTVLNKLAAAHEFDCQQIALDDMGKKTYEFMHTLSEKEMMKLLKYFIPVQEFKYFL